MARRSGGLSLWYRSRVGVPGEEHKSLPPQGQALCYEISPNCGSAGPEVGFLASLGLYLFYLSQCGPFLLCCGGAVQLAFKVLCRGKFSRCSCRFLVFGGIGEFRILLCLSLEPSSIFALLGSAFVLDYLFEYSYSKPNTSIIKTLNYIKLIFLNIKTLYFGQ